ncbi:MAG: hypothetical protein ACKOJI_11230, partial [Phycisphaerales bacterium]
MDTVRERTDAVGHPMRMAVTCAQATMLALLVIAGSQLLWLPDLARLAIRDGNVTAIDARTLACVAILAAPAWAMATLVLAAAAKWMIIGRYRPMRVRAWSWWHLRHWTVVRAASLVPWGLLETAGLAPMALRLLGARIGRNVHVHAGVRLTEGGWDLLTLEDGATIGQDASLRTVDLDAGCIVVAPVTVRRNATVETRAGMSGGAELGEGSILRPLSNLAAGEVHSHTVLDGVPAVPVGDAPRLHVPDDPAPWVLRAPARRSPRGHRSVPESHRPDDSTSADCAAIRSAAMPWSDTRPSGGGPSSRASTPCSRTIDAAAMATAA